MGSQNKTIRMKRLESLFKKSKPIIGMVSLPALPGSPEGKQSMKEILERAKKDAQSLVSGGIDGCMIENFGDRPFFQTEIPGETVAAMAIITNEIRNIFPSLPIGVNALRNASIQGLGIAHVANANFIRCNILTEAYVTDQGLIQGVAAELKRYQKFLGADNVQIFADVHTKHGTPLAKRSIVDAAADTLERGLGDAVIISGNRTGEPPSIEDLQSLNDADLGPVLIGSGLSLENVEEIMSLADGAIVGTSIKENRIIEREVSVEHVKALINAVNALR